MPGYLSVVFDPSAMQSEIDVASAAAAGASDAASSALLAWETGGGGDTDFLVVQVFS